MRPMHGMLSAALLSASAWQAQDAAAQLNGGMVSQGGEPYQLTVLSDPSATPGAVDNVIADPCFTATSGANMFQLCAIESV